MPTIIVHIGEQYNAEWYYQYAISHKHEPHVMMANMIEAANRGHDGAVDHFIEHVKDISTFTKNDDFVHYIYSSSEYNSKNHWSHLTLWYFLNCMISRYLDMSCEQNNPLALIHKAGNSFECDDVITYISQVEVHFPHIIDKYPYILLPTYIHLASLYEDDDDEKLEILYYVYDQYEYGLCPINVLLNIANILHTDHPEDSLAFLNEYLEHNTTESLIWPYYLMADCYFTMKEYAKSWEYAHKSLESGGGFETICISDPVYHIGHMYDHITEYRNFEKAVTYYKKAIDIDGNLDAMIQLGTYYDVEEEDHEKAVEYYKRAFDCGCLQGASYLATHYYNNDDYDESWKWCMIFEEQDDDIRQPTPASVYHIMANIMLSRDDDRDRAISYLKMAADEGDELAIEQIAEMGLLRP